MLNPSGTQPSEGKLSLVSFRGVASLVQGTRLFLDTPLPTVELCQTPAFLVLHSQPPALSQLVSLYLGRSHFLWKDPTTMSWLEENVREVLQAVDAGDPAVEACENR